MKETERDWDLILKTASRKVILCYDRTEKQEWVFSLGAALSRDKTYESVGRKHFDEIIVRDTVLNVDFLINFYCTNQWSWADKTRCLIYDEVLVTRRGFERMEYPENLPEVLSRCRKTGSISEMSLYLLARNDQKISAKQGNDIAKTTAFDGENVGTMSEDFDFPSSLFRRSMMPYFEDFRSPTREEFLLALTMENISGSTAREKKAIEEAILYVEGKGNKANSGSAE